MNNLLISYDDRIRPDSTAIYFKKAFEYLMGKDSIFHLYPEELQSTASKYDLYLKVDDGLEQHRWNPSLHPSAYYIIDTHIDLEWRKKLAAEGKFDYLFFAQKDGLNKEWHTNNKYWVPLGADPDLHYAGVKQKNYDVCFIGWFHSIHAKERINYCHELFKNFPNFYYGNKTFLDMASKFAESKLVFNKALNKDINMRFFEAQCSGSALLTDIIPEMTELGFEENKHYIGYNSIEEMLDKARYYIKNDFEREKIAFTGMRFVHQNHTYFKRANDIISKIIRNREVFQNA